MHRNALRALAAVGAVVVLAGGTAGAVALTTDSSAASGPAATSSTADSAAVVQRYWSDTKSALAPLLLYVRVLPETRAALERSDGQMNAGQRHLAGVMADSFAAAREWVGRLAAPVSVPGNVDGLMQIACSLYRQSALALLDLRSPSAADGALRRSTALQTIGDRVIDQVRRMVNIDGIASDAAHVELQYAPPVPPLAELTGDGASALRTAAASLESDQRGENVIGARLAILLAVVAEDARAAGSPTSAALVRLSKDLWATTRALSGARPAVDIDQILGG